MVQIFFKFKGKKEIKTVWKHCLKFSYLTWTIGVQAL